MSQELPNNRLLRALPASCMERLLAASELVELPLRTLLFRAEEIPRYLYFLTGGIGSVVFLSQEGTSIEISTQGNEGLIGTSYLLGPEPKSSACDMQVAGAGYRIPLATMQAEFDNYAETRQRVLQYEQMQYISACQIAACNRLHRAEARFARWLLMVADRIQSPELHMTQEFLANMLGARRTTVAEVCAELGRAGMIEGRRGGLRIVNRRALEQRACECYPILRNRFEGLYQTPLRPMDHPRGNVARPSGAA